MWDFLYIAIGVGFLALIVLVVNRTSVSVKP